MSYSVQTGLDNALYIVFDCPTDAYSVSVSLDIATYSFGAFENAILLTDFLCKTVPLSQDLGQVLKGLSQTAALVETAAQNCETPGSWSFHDRDTARDNASKALAILVEAKTNADLDDIETAA